MSKRVLRSFVFGATLSYTIWAVASPVHAGTRVIRDDDMNLNLGLMLREICVDTFPRFAKAASVIGTKSYFQRRAGEKIWDHKNLAVTIALSRVDGKPACVMHIVAKRWKEGTWAAYAVPVFGAIWKSDETIVAKGKGHPGDEFQQHMLIRFPTRQIFKFDADRRDDGLWAYSISLVAAK